MARKSKKQTLTEFQAWLQGITEIQPDDWSPTADQWKMIYAKIIAIKETVVEKVAPAPAPQPYAPGFQQPQTYLAPPAPTHMPAINPGDIEMTPAAKEMLETGKTPHSETGEASSFE